MTELVTRDGWLMPAAVDPKQFAQWQAEAVERIDLALPHIKQWRHVVQAGGNLGIWPRMLAEVYQFEHTTTFEPDEVNFRCLVENTRNYGVRAKKYALGASKQRVGWSRASEHKPGWHKIAPQGCRKKYLSGEVPVIALDDYFSPEIGYDEVPVDFLALDIEGYELEALKGAERTITRHRPVILFEDMGRSRFAGFRKRSTVAYGNAPGAVQKWLAERGYRKVAEIKNDECWAPE